MRYSDQSYHLHLEIDAGDRDVGAEDVAQMERSLERLRKLVEDFPVAHLLIQVTDHARNRDCHVKTRLVLNGSTLVTGSRGPGVPAAFRGCVGKLVHRVVAYKQRLSGSPLASLPEADGVTPAIDSYRLAQAARSGDYPSFRGMLLVFEEPLRRRLGQRHPEVEAHLGEALRIDDLVEEVFLQAFEGFCTRPHEVAPGDWLESLIDPAVRALSEAPDEELDNLSFVRSLWEVEPRAPCTEEIRRP